MRLVTGALALCFVLTACGQPAEKAEPESSSMYDFQIEKVLQNGGSMRVSAQKFYDFQLVKMAAAANQGGGRLTVQDWKGKLYDFQMEKIAASGPGHVEFE